MNSICCNYDVSYSLFAIYWTEFKIYRQLNAWTFLFIYLFSKNCSWIFVYIKKKTKTFLADCKSVFFTNFIAFYLLPIGITIKWSLIFWINMNLSCPAVSQSWRWTLKFFSVAPSELVPVYIWCGIGVLEDRKY